LKERERDVKETVNDKGGAKARASEKGDWRREEAETKKKIKKLKKN